MAVPYPMYQCFLFLYFTVVYSKFTQSLRMIDDILGQCFVYIIFDVLIYKSTITCVEWSQISILFFYKVLIKLVGCVFFIINIIQFVMVIDIWSLFYFPFVSLDRRNFWIWNDLEFRWNFKCRVLIGWNGFLKLTKCDALHRVCLTLKWNVCQYWKCQHHLWRIIIYNYIYNSFVNVDNDDLV